MIKCFCKHGIFDGNRNQWNFLCGLNQPFIHDLNIYTTWILIVGILLSYVPKET